MGDLISSKVLQQTQPVERLHDSVHQTINKIHKLVPSSSSTLMNCLVEYFPHQRRETITHLIYVKNMLRISENISILRDSILTAIIERLIKLDVEITPGGTLNQQVSDDQQAQDDDLIFSLSLEDDDPSKRGKK